MKKMLMHTDIWRGGSFGLFSVSPLLRCSTQLSYVVSLKPTHNTPAPKKRRRQGNNNNKNRNRVRIMEWKKKVSSNKRARNDRFFRWCLTFMYLSSLGLLSLFDLFSYMFLSIFSILLQSILNVNPTSRHMEMMMATESMCEEREDEGKKRFSCLVMCPIKCAAFLYLSIIPPPVPLAEWLWS